MAFNDGRQAQAAVVGTDAETDLAVIQVEGDGFPAIALASSKDIEVGDLVLAIGNPFGIGQAVSQGIVSARGPLRHQSEPGRRLHPDRRRHQSRQSSGGALVDAHGRLVGINTMIYSQGGGSEGIGFAIPVDRAIKVLDAIVEHGRVLRGWLGVRLAKPLGSNARGLMVRSVVAGAPAHSAGFAVWRPAAGHQRRSRFVVGGRASANRQYRTERQAVAAQSGATARYAWSRRLPACRRTCARRLRASSQQLQTRLIALVAQLTSRRLRRRRAVPPRPFYALSACPRLYVLSACPRRSALSS